ncbi:anaerobic sulfatase maturase [Faecalimonas sp.]
MKYISFLIKPASSLCNLRCPYCFYEDVSKMREKKSYGKMDEEVMKILVLRAIEETEEDATLVFAFQGGEPMLAGIEYYKKFVELVREKKGSRKVQYALQTNGTLIDEEWARFFWQEKFLVGISLDGYESNTNRFRVDESGNGMYEKIIRGINLLKKYKVEHNILSVITSQLAKHTKAYYKFLKSQKFSYVQCIPCLGELNRETKWQLRPEEYAEFYKKLYRLWLADYLAGEYMSITLFDNLLLMLSDRPPQQCGMLGFCTAQCVVESDGSVYPCDFYVLDSYKCGNIKNDRLEEILKSDQMFRFIKEEKHIPTVCKTCPFWKICRGGCKRQNSAFLRENWCGHREFLTEAYPTLIKIARSIC